jgi:quercetin dioxygenase-like cupin family protein
LRVPQPRRFTSTRSEVQPEQPTTKGPAEWFTGDVWIDAIAQGHGSAPMSIGSVHFTPNARTACHRHLTGQTLYVTEGEGRVQSRGEPLVTIRPGDVLHTSPASGTGTEPLPTTS